MQTPQVLIVMGSESDAPVMEEAAKVLADFGVAHRMTIASAHRTPEKAAQLAREAGPHGVRVLIAGAGFAAHLAGALAAHTILPVIGVPLPSSTLSGFDALLSTAQMPVGIPVATVAVGKAGARNAAILAVQILALSDASLRQKLQEHRTALAEGVEEADRRLQEACR